MNSLRIISIGPWSVVFLILLGFFLTGCGGPPFEIGEPEVVEPPPPVSPGEQVSVKIVVSSSKPVSYKWSSEEGRGKIISGEMSSAAIWQAPQTPGLYNIYVEVTIDSVVTGKSVAVSVQDPSQPTDEPTEEPTKESTVEPMDEPAAEPTEEPTAEPTDEPAVEPTEEPTAEPTDEPAIEPTAEPTDEPAVEPTEEPTAEPTAEPPPPPPPPPPWEVDITGIPCKVKMADAADFKVWLRQTDIDTHFTPLGLNPPFPATARLVVDPTTENLCPLVPLRVDSLKSSKGMGDWTDCVLTMNKEVRTALNCDLEEMVNKPIEDREDRTLRFVVGE